MWHSEFGQSPEDSPKTDIVVHRDGSYTRKEDVPAVRIAPQADGPILNQVRNLLAQKTVRTKPWHGCTTVWHYLVAFFLILLLMLMIACVLLPSCTFGPGGLHEEFRRRVDAFVDSIRG